jgi:hypothetical protein
VSVSGTVDHCATPMRVSGLTGQSPHGHAVCIQAPVVPLLLTCPCRPLTCIISLAPEGAKV